MVVNVNLIIENVTEFKIGITINVDVSEKVCLNIVYAKKYYVWNPST